MNRTGLQKQKPGQPAFEFVHLRWPFERRGRPFSVRVVEPRSYDPINHADIFRSVMVDLLSPIRPKIDEFAPEVPLDADLFDLLTFPEAFVPAIALVETLKLFRYSECRGLVHVGLRPSAGERHLFKPEEVRDLITELEILSDKTAADLKPVSDWLGRQKTDIFLNFGCLFMVDADGELRVWLHPKIVRSKAETSTLPEDHMAEANLLSLLTLEPENKSYITINLQPLLCSDALSVGTDRPTGGPLVAINRYASGLHERVPDHIDIVSIATCTKQSRTQPSHGEPYRSWHNRFRDAFRSLAENADHSRHHFSAVAMANFQELSETAVGGLSGLFLPVAPSDTSLPDGITVSCWGREPGTEDNSWSRPGPCPPKDWNNRGFIASLAPLESGDAVVRILRSTIHRFPRENSLWDKSPGLTQCSVRVGQRDLSGSMTFREVSEIG